MEKTQNSRQKLKVSAKSKTRFAEIASKKKPAIRLLVNPTALPEDRNFFKPILPSLLSKSCFTAIFYSMPE